MVAVDQVVLNRADILELDNDNVLYAYDRFVAAYNRHPDGFNREVRNDDNYPMKWYMGLTRQLLSITERVRLAEKIKVITIMYKLNIVYRNLFNHDSFRYNYKDTAIMKAREFIDDEIVPRELKNVLEHFLAIMH
jgi:hypothetical protein